MYQIGRKSRWQGSVEVKRICDLSEGLLRLQKLFFLRERLKLKKIIKGIDNCVHKVYICIYTDTQSIDTHIYETGKWLCVE